MPQNDEPDISVSATVLAAALQLPPAEVLRRIHVRQITAVHEHGVDDDLGRERLSFYAGNRRVQLLIDETGRVLECKVSHLHRRTPSSVRASMTADEARAELTAAASEG